MPPRASCSLRVTHRFTPRLDPDALDRDPPQPAARRYTADVLFPSWRGARTASVVAVLRDGTQVTVGSTPDPAARRSTTCGCAASTAATSSCPPHARAGAGVHALRAAAQSSDPRPGPTAAIQIARAQRFSRAALTVRLTPVHDEQEAAAAAARLT